jgi:hypothetical protein
MFLKNHNVVDIIKEQLDETDLTKEFYATYTDCAKGGGVVSCCCYDCKCNSDCACDCDCCVCDCN